jgi:PPM family protein phosphatase
LSVPTEPTFYIKFNPKIQVLITMLNINFAGKTNVGLKRSSNEDVFIIEGQKGFCLVADGLGGAAAGDIASRFFAEATVEVFHKAADLDEENVVMRIQESFRLAHDKIRDHIRENPLHDGMGCTAELLAFSDQGFVVGHLGDSRTYRFRDGHLKQLTHDHSLVQDQLDKGLIGEEKARRHPLRNVILKAVGIDEDLALDLIRGRTYPEDQFLLCSDGLTDMVEDVAIGNVFNSPIPAGKKVDQLIDLALAGGGKDNITVVLIEIKGS